jgi:hypothetical protein
MKTLTVCALFLATPALADEFVFFQSPTGNIGCMAIIGDTNEVRCDLRELDPSFTNRPASCDLDWGDSFAIGANDARGSLVCHGDTVFDPGASVLRYGRTGTFGPFTCTSLKTGMTCTNSHGHGFSVARAQQSVF